MAPKRRRIKKSSSGSGRGQAQSRYSFQLHALPDIAQQVIGGYSTEPTWLSLVNKESLQGYGTKLPVITLKQAMPSILPLASLLKRQECLQELNITARGILSSVVAILARGKCKTLKKITIQTIDVKVGELDALAAVIELGELPALEALHINSLSSFLNFEMPKFSGRLVVDLKKLLDAVLSLPSFKSLSLPWGRLTSIDVEALADGLEKRKKKGLLGLEELSIPGDNYVMVNEAGRYEVDYEHDDGDNENIPPERYHRIARILKVCLSSVKRLIDPPLYKHHHFEAFGECLTTTPALALKEVNLEGNRVDEEELEGEQAVNVPLFDACIADRMPVLEKLVIKNRQLGGPAAISLSRAIKRGAWPRLKCLEFTGCFLNGGAVVAIADADAMVKAEDRLPHLESFNLGHNYFIGSEGIAALCAAFKAGACPELQSLGLCDDNVGTDGLKALSLALQAGACPHLSRLDITGNRICSEGLTALSEALQAGACPHLSCLDIDGNKICSEGLTALSLALQKGACPRLEELSFRDNKDVDDDGLVSFASALKQGGAPCSQTLRQLCFRDCRPITSEGVKALFDAMAGALPSIENIDFRGCSIGDEGITHILNGLARGAGVKMQRLDLIRTGMTDVGTMMLGEALAKQALPSSLIELSVDSGSSFAGKFTAKGRNAIREGLKNGGWLGKKGFSCYNL